MAPAKTANPSGLEGMIAGNTYLCKIDAENIELLYRGYSIDELVEHSTFEEVAYLLLYGELPSKEEFEEFRQCLLKEMKIPEEVEKVIRDIPKDTDPMDMLKIVVGVLALTDPDAYSNSREANLRKAVRLTAKIPAIIAGSYRISHGKDILTPRSRFSIALNFLYMLKGKKPEDFETGALDKSLILYAEHGYNASTFAARVCASTLSDMHSAIVTAIGTLKGPLHGGANERAMEMLLEIKTPDNVESWLKKAFSEKKRIMGFGHRVYKTKDPRNPYVKEISKSLGERLGRNKWFEISQKVEKIMDREKGLHPNLDFYAASAYYLLGIPIPLYTPIFAASRIVGWAANVIEQHSNNRLIRPKGEYAGPERRSYIPLDERQ